MTEVVLLQRCHCSVQYNVDARGVFGDELLDVNEAVPAHAYVLEPAIDGHEPAKVAMRCR